MLDSFEIRNFRTFAHLQIPKLRRVNLIVGENNVGKTMLLEAIRLYATNNEPSAIATILAERDEVAIRSAVAGESPLKLLKVEALFCHRKVGQGRNPVKISLGPISQPNGISIWIDELDDQDRAWDLDESGIDHVDLFPHGADVPFRALTIQRGKVRKMVDLGWSELGPSQFGPEATSPAFINPGLLPSRRLSEWWDAISMRDGEQRVIEAMRLMCPVERINLIGHPWNAGERIPMARLAGEDEPVTLKSLGDGMMRMFQIALAIEFARAGAARAASNGKSGSHRERVVLIDEIESGIHYSVLPKLWRFVLKVAELHDVQVFATTHSWDCIRALREAVREHESEDDVALIRLEAGPNGHRAVEFAQHELPAVAEQGIEVR